MLNSDIVAEFDNFSITTTENVAPVSNPVMSCHFVSTAKYECYVLGRLTV